MINTSEIKQNLPTPQIAGLHPKDTGIEFAGDKTTKTVFWLQHGCTHYFADLPLEYFTMLKKQYNSDTPAKEFLSAVTDKVFRQVELYTYYMYGDLDATPDIINGKLSDSENFRDKNNCPSLRWSSKNINIGNYILTPRDLVIIDLIANDLPDKAIANALNISISTLDYHKRNLFKAVNVQTKPALIKLAIKHHIV